MFPRLRAIALLMLLAGLSLGIFTARALRALGEADQAPRTDGRTPRIELQIDLYRRDFHLDDGQADRVRRVLYDYDRQVEAKIWELRQRHAEEFQTLYDVAEQRILEVFAEAAKER